MSVIVHSTGKDKLSIGLAGALRWSVLATSSQDLRKKNSIIRNQASLIGAHSYATRQIGDATYLGLYTQSAIGVKKIKSIHSLGIAFLAALTGPDVDPVTVNAILLVEPAQMSEKRALVVIEGGEIVRDVIEGASEAIANAMRARESLPSHVVYAQYPEISGAQTVTWEQLLDGCSQDSILQPVPKSPLLLVGIAVVLMAVGGYFAYQKMVVEPEKKRKALAAAAAADQTPVYLAQLRASLSALGWDRKELSKRLADLNAFPMYHAGWALEKRECLASAQKCETQWKRTGGQLSALQKLLGEASYDVAVSNLDTTTMSHNQPVQAEKLEMEQLPEIGAAAKQLREVLQRLSNAEISVSTANSEKWPAMDFKNVKPAVVASRGSIEITAPLPKVIAVLAELPSTVVMDSYTLVVGSGDVGSLFKVTLKGYVYAK